MKMLLLLQGEDVEVAFIKEGSFLGALGAFLANVDKQELTSWPS